MSMGHFAAAYRDKANSRSRAAAAGGSSPGSPSQLQLTLGVRCEPTQSRERHAVHSGPKARSFSHLGPSPI
jgi:hypothetical protein